MLVQAMKMPVDAVQVSRPANDSALEAVRVLLKAVRVLVKAVRVKAVRVGELC